MVKKILIFIFLYFAFSNISLFAQDISIEATVNAQTASVGDQITYSVIVRGSSGNLPQPQLPALNDFKVYDSGTSSSFQFVNGQVSSSVAYNYVIVPVKEGTFVIPPVTLSYNNKTYQSQSVTITVTKQNQKPQTTAPPQQQAPTVEEQLIQQSQAGEIFVKTIVNKEKVYVDEPLTLSYKVYFRNVSPEQVGLEKVPDFSGFWAEDVPPEKLHTRNTEMYENKRYYTQILYKKILFPTSPGNKSIGSIKFDFVIQDFFSFFGKKVVRDTNPVTINVEPLPIKGKPANFKGTVGSYEISSKLSTKNITQNEPFSLNIVISGTGNIKSISDLDVPPLQNFRIYDTHSSINVQKK